MMNLKVFYHKTKVMGLKSYSPHNWGIQSPINPLSKSKQPRFFDESHGNFGFSGRCKSKVGISRSGPFCAPRSGGEITPGKQPMYKAIYRGYKSICNYGGSQNGGTQQPQVFLLKMINTWGVKWGYHHLRKHACSRCPPCNSLLSHAKS